MRFIRSHGFPLLIAIVVVALFLIGFSWLKPGEMDLGGDSSRLYFYDPIQYLRSQSLYAMSPSGLGGANFSYYGIPFFLLLAFLKYILKTPTNLILLFYGASLSLAFLFTYLSVRAIVWFPADRRSKNRANLSALIAGLFYVFSPSSILGWGHNILTYYQIFLNPLMFYLILNYFLTQKNRYLYIALPITVLFAANFSYVGAPPFFAFYPLSVLFIILYTLLIRKLSIRWRDIGVASLLFFGLHAFQLLPIINDFINPAGSIHAAVFSETAKHDRGFNYFNGIASSVRVTLNWMNLPQLTKGQPIDYAFIIFPLIFLLGFIRNKSRNLLLSGIFFLIAFFWMSAKITNLGFSFYAALFAVPGFAMFRNFFGQWGFFFLFFFVLMIGQSFYIFLRTSKKLLTTMVVLLAIAVMAIKAWPMINGSIVNTFYWGSNDVKIPFRMDPFYEKVLDYFRKNVHVGKIFLFPIADHGYQAISGIDKKTAYVGPSTISYLTEKQDFASYDELGQYKDLVIRLGRSKNYELFKKTLRLLGVRYIFYNDDPAIFDDFPGFPYGFVKTNYPPDRIGYENFINNLNLKEEFAIDNKYYLYTLRENEFSPEVYTTTRAFSFDHYVKDWMTPISIDDGNSVNPIYFEETIPSAQRQFFEAIPTKKYDEIIKNQDPPLVLHNAFASIPPWAPHYSFVMFREYVVMQNFFRKMSPDKFIDKRLFYSTKRVFETEKYGKDLTVNKISTDPVKLADYFKNSTVLVSNPRLLSSWEWELARYFQYMSENIKTVNSSNLGEDWKLRQNFLINEYLLQHHLRFAKVIREVGTTETGSYLFDLIDNMFYVLQNMLDYQKIVVKEMKYTIDLPQGNRPYNVFVNNQNFIHDAYDVVLNDIILHSKNFTKTAYWDIYGGGSQGVAQNGGKQIVVLSDSTNPNLMATAIRYFPDTVKESDTDKSVNIDTSLFQGQQGIFWKLPNWHADSYYVLSFDYRAPKIPFVAKLFDSSVSNTGIREYQNILTESFVSDKRLHYEAVVKTGNFSDAAVLGFTTYPYQYENSELEVRNLEIYQIPLTKILFNAVNNEHNTESPRATFTKNSKVKYTIHIQGARQPYYLVLNQWANANWKVYRKPKNDTSFFKDFSWFQQKTIADNNHYRVNGYANAWYITPGMMNGETEYDLVVEMISQRYFYLSSIISIVTLIIFIPLFIRSLWQRR